MAIFEYPDLKLIEYIFDQKLREHYPEVMKVAKFPKYRAEVFCQLWPNTAGGFDAPGMCSGQAFTNQYTTVMEMTWSIRRDDGSFYDSTDEIYGVFFGNRLAYLISNPAEIFFADKLHRNMKCLGDSSVYIDKSISESDINVEK